MRGQRRSAILGVSASQLRSRAARSKLVIDDNQRSRTTEDTVRIIGGFRLMHEMTRCVGVKFVEIERNFASSAAPGRVQVKALASVATPFPKHRLSECRRSFGHSDEKTRLHW